MVASWLLWTDQVDEVWLTVSHHHPFGKESAPFQDRLAWCRAAVARLPRVEVSGVEGTLAPPNYTIDTLEALTTAHPEHRFRFVLGSDGRAVVSRWHRWEDIEARFDPIVVARAGHLGALDQETMVEGPVFPEVSSTDVRTRARNGEPIDRLVPRAVHDLVLQHYRSPTDAPSSDA